MTIKYVYIASQSVGSKWVSTLLENRSAERSKKCACTGLSLFPPSGKTKSRDFESCNAWT